MHYNSVFIISAMHITCARVQLEKKILVVTLEGLDTKTN
jgi:hypothetical protein